MSKKHTIILNEKEQEILEKLINEGGWRKQEVFRYRLRDLYKKEFPPYNQSKKKENRYDKMTDEEYCMKVLGGRVEGERCVIPQSNGQLEVPLIGVKFL